MPVGRGAIHNRRRNHAADATINHKIDLVKKFRRLFIPVGLLITLANLLSFADSMEIAPFFRIQNFQKVELDRMTKLRLVKPRDLPPTTARTPSESYMYREILRGEIVPNCYLPLNATRVLAGEAQVADGVTISPDSSIGMISEHDEERVSDECKQSIYFTQNQIHIDRKQCPKGLCIRVNGTNIYRNEPLKIDSAGKQFCLE